MRSLIVPDEEPFSVHGIFPIGKEMSKGREASVPCDESQSWSTLHRI